MFQGLLYDANYSKGTVIKNVYFVKNGFSIY